MPDHELDDIRETRRERDRLDRQLRELVAIARGKGYSWEKIAQALGTSRPAAWERYSRDEPHRDPS